MPVALLEGTSESPMSTAPLATSDSPLLEPPPAMVTVAPLQAVANDCDAFWTSG